MLPMKRVLLVLSLLFAVAPAHAQAIVGIGGAMSDDDILDAIERVDGPGSQLDADFLDGMSSQEFCAVTGGANCSMVGCITIDNAGNPNSTYCEDGIDRVSATDTTFTIQNSGAGGMTFQVSGNITAAAAGASCVSGTPGYAFAGDLDSGFANDGVGTTRFCANANTVGEMSSGAMSMYVPLYATPGATGAQGIAFRNDTDTGIYNTAGSMFFEANAVQVATMSTTGVVFNESGSATKDLRVEGDTNANLVFADASADAVAFGTATQVDIGNRVIVALDQAGTDIDAVSAALGVRNGNQTNGNFSILSLQTIDSGGAAAGIGRIAARINSHTAASINGDLIFQTRAGSGSNWTEPVIFTYQNYAGFGTLSPGARMDVRGLAGIPALIVNENGLDSDVRMESDTNPNMFVLDASANAIGFGTNAPGTGTVTTAVDIWPSTDGARWLGASGLGWAGVLVDSGSAASPAVAFDDDPDTGTWFPAANEWAVTTGGTTRVTVSTSTVTSTLPVLVPAGASLAAPGFANSTLTDSGIAWDTGADIMYVSNDSGSVAVRANGGGGLAIESDNSMTIMTNDAAEDITIDPTGVLAVDGLIEAHAGVAGTVTTGTGPGGVTYWRVPNLRNAAPVKPTCDTTWEGSIMYVDDTGDAVASMMCYCAADTARTTFAWLIIGLGTACPGA